MKTDKDIRTNKSIFLVAFYVLMVSRILVLTNNYTWFINPILLEVLYLILVVALLIVKNRFVFRLHHGAYLYVLAVMLVHTVLWGVFFRNKQFEGLIHDHFESQILFVIIICITVWAIHQLRIEKSFLMCACYALSTVLLVQFVKNIHEVDLSNLVNIFSAHDRTRSNFGFGHYNALGTACVCNLILLGTIHQRKKVFINVMHFALVIISVIMLLCSASRSALTSLILYLAILAFLRMDRLSIRKRQILYFRVSVLLVAFVAMAAIFATMDVVDLLEETQRFHLFTDTLPMFLESGRTLMGLGYASTVSYAQRLTPYTTLWLDNAYIYFLVTTGFVGLAVILSATVCMGIVIWRNRKLPNGDQILAIFCVYLYISLFEAVLFNSGNITNYIYLPWMIGKLVHKGVKCDKTQLSYFSHAQDIGE